MATRPPRRSSAHEEAVARRLALLGAELAAVRGEDRAPLTGPDTSTDPHTDTHTRIRPGRERVGWAESSWDEAVETPDVGEVPLPGRHSSRRPSALASVLPRGVRGRLALGPSQLAVVALLVVVGLVATGWWLLRSRPSEVAVPTQPVPARTLVDLGSPGGPSAGATTTSSTVTVDVAGRVRRPGIAVLRTGDRVVDALEAAGGARAGVDLTGLNLARVLVDGEQILVGVQPPAGVAASVPGGTSPVATLVNLNTADQVALESLPEVGPVTAQAILAWRTDNGAFTAVDQLLDVDGIGEATLAKLTPFVTL
jgi:competence protein ComEA